MSDQDPRPPRRPPPPPVTEDEGASDRSARAPGPGLPSLEAAPAVPAREPAPAPAAPAAPAREPAPAEEKPALRLELPTRKAPQSPPAPPSAGSARAAMDELEAKGLFLIRTPAPAAPKPLAPPVPSSPLLSDWDAFALDESAVGPLSSTPRAGGLAPERRPPPETRREPSPARDEYLQVEPGGPGVAGLPPRSAPRALEDRFPAGVVRLFDRRDWARLIEGFQRVIPTAPQEPSPWIGLAICALAQQDLPTAVRIFDYALSLDPTLEPGALLAEVLGDKPDPWLRLAEELARRGHVAQAVDLCNRVAVGPDFPRSAQRRAITTRHKIRYEHALAQAGPEGGASERTPWDLGRLARILGVLLALLVLLGIAAVAGARTGSAYFTERGQADLAEGLVLAERLGRGDRTADRELRAEDALASALSRFDEALRWYPWNARAAYLGFRTSQLALKVAKIRQNSPGAWSRARWEQARADEARTRERLRALLLDQAAMQAEDTAWKVLQTRALQGGGGSY